jgi:hypothetical protein
MNEQNEVIGTVEGNVNEVGELISIVKIFHPDYIRKGIGYQSFKKIFEDINKVVPITIIKGNWHSGGEFQDFENGMSTNLKVYKENLISLSPEESAFLTPTGKWAKKIRV